MIEDILRKLSKRDRDAVASMAQRVMDIARTDLDLSDKARQALTVAAGSGVSLGAVKSILGTAGRKSRRAASRTTAYVVEHPRQVGIGVGTAAVAAVGIVALARMYEKKKSAIDAPDTPEELAERLSAEDAD